MRNAELVSREASRSEAERVNQGPRSSPTRSASRLTIPLPPSPFRPAFTLIELLVAISIIATLSAMFLGASRAAMEHSRAARTRTTIDKLNTLLMERWADYETRRVDLAFVPPTAEATADYRLLALRELMKFEMPDRWSDIDLDASVNPIGKTASRDQATVFLKNVPPLARIYYRRFQEAQSKANANGKPDSLTQYEGPECLYMTIMYACGDGESRSMFSTQDIGDVDGDGAPEFLDGWGNPIDFVRWPAGFAARSSLMSWNDEQNIPDADNDHDPFDPFRRDLMLSTQDYTESNPNLARYIARLRDDSSAFRLVPLIYSAGPDGEYEIDVKAPTPTSDSNGVALDPYFIESDESYVFGTPQDFNGDGSDNSLDNIHNHQDTTR
jgi:prepilin-type N-terminal cleavage/methylation domain-containing protein